MVFHAGTTLDDGTLHTSGGRVLCVTALGDSVKLAQQRAYEALRPSASTARSTAATSATAPSSAEMITAARRRAERAAGAVARQRAGARAAAAGRLARAVRRPARAQGVADRLPAHLELGLPVGLLAKWAHRHPGVVLGQGHAVQAAAVRPLAALAGRRAGGPQRPHGVVGAWSSRLRERAPRADFIWLALAPEGTRARGGLAQRLLPRGAGGRVPLGLVRFDYAGVSVGFGAFCNSAATLPDRHGRHRAAGFRCRGGRPPAAGRAPIRLKPMMDIDQPSATYLLGLQDRIVDALQAEDGKPSSATAGRASPASGCRATACRAGGRG
jgi:1-acyl-sn-glycerol-3-phosphate acyltransferase